MSKTYEIKHTPAQHKLYELLEEIYMQDDKKYTNMREIYSMMILRYGFEYYDQLNKNTAWNNQKARRDLTRDIEALKNSESYQHIVISNVNGVKLANEEDIQALEREKISLLESLKRVYFQLKKAQLNGQYKIPFNQEKDIIEVFRKESVSADYWD
jgi:hypothetical protein